MTPAVPASSSSSVASCASSSSEDPDVDANVAEIADTSQIVMHKVTKAFHVSADGQKLNCGKECPTKYEVVSRLPSGARLCHRCF